MHLIRFVSNHREFLMKLSKLAVIALLTGILLSLIFTSVSAQSFTHDPAPGSGTIVIAPPSDHKKSDCNKNGIDDLDEFYPPDCWRPLTSSGGGDR
jgi:hypothetical protein